MRKVHVALAQAPPPSYDQAPKKAKVSPTQDDAVPDDEKDQAQQEVTVDRWFMRLKRVRTIVFDRGLRFSWLRLFGSVFSYAMLCSDVARSGIGFQTENVRAFDNVEPAMIFISGPWAYPVIQIRGNETDDTVVDVWSYKFDSTSIVTRSFAAHLNATAYPECVLYHGKCADDAITTTTLYSMLDQIVNRTAARANDRRFAHLEPVGVTIRCLANFLDRLHEDILPITPPWRRTNQAVYYHPALLQDPLFDMCSTKHGARSVFCGDIWTNYGRTCDVNFADPDSCAHGLVWNNIRARTAALQEE